MMTSTNKSRPVYAPLEADPRGTQHWLVISGATEAARSSAFSALSNVSPLEVWSVEEDMAHAGAGAACAVPNAVAHRFDGEDELLGALGVALRGARVGLRIYALGTEPFIWSVQQVAALAGIALEAVRLVHSGSLQRRVYCIHCRTMNEGVATNLVPCAGCGRHLFVRDHFSCRLAAFMGVQADAEVPGELPEIEHTYL
ncbi:dimethylamine monooxygenase subunit DmmA family protein [Paraburkholderia mimosarum]|uniref:dimethylamine monooxygenase subunit DmmA family protein n=1 Tax=Paraburkholderia mimosarum TaxID=312026 RepID=UPI00040F1064|nr:dimethylamine monooxygenase subunit DmmA family protein [Paraburkholderia mimosarum]